jgi:MFS family permease
MLSKFKATYRKFSRNFWLLMFASFVDMLGGSLIFPFFSLYLTQKFNVGMTQVGTMFLVWALTSGLIGNMLGGAMADRFGRKTNMIFGLIASATSALLMVVIQDIVVFYIAIAIVGIFEDIAGPARQAMITDLVPEELRGDAFGMFRIVFNLSATIGPAIGGFMASRSFELLFFADVVISLLVAVFVFIYLPETRPQHVRKETAKEESFAETMQGYAHVLRDKVFMAFIFVSILSTLMYFNMNSSMSVYLVNFRGFTSGQFGYLLSLNAFMVVVLQMLFTRLTAKWKPMLAIAFGNVLYVVGFTMFGFIASYNYYLSAMVIITIGEMIYAPKEQAIVADFAPEDMRGRYMAIRSFAWIIPVAFGPLGAGLIMDNLDPRLLWFVAGGIGTLSVIGFLILHFKAGSLIESRLYSAAKEEELLVESLVEAEKPLLSSE